MICRHNLTNVLRRLLLLAATLAPGSNMSLSGEVERHQAAYSSFEEWLLDFSLRYDCYFTIEVQDGSRLPDMLPNVVWGDLSEEDAIAELAVQLPGFDISRSDPQCRVYRLRDNALAKDATKSPINKRLNGFSFRGPPEKLIQKINSIVPEIRQKATFEIGSGPLVFDYTTPLSISSTSASVYAILTNYIPLSKYHRIIFEATLSKDASGESVAIRYGGSSRIPSRADGLRPKPKFTLANGEMFYWLVKKGKAPLPQDAILASITRTLRGGTGGHPLQRRWAIKCLGVLPLSPRTESLLLANADYAYSGCNLLEERYPAVNAISNLDADGDRVIRTLLDRDLPPDLMAYLRARVD